MNVQIRKAVKSDMPMVLEMIQELATFEKETDAVALTTEQLEQDFKANLFSCLIAEKDEEEIVGMALYYNRYSTWKGKTIHLEDLIVRQNYRGCGIGKKLLDQLMRIAKEDGLQRVEWAVLDWNVNAIAFYEKVGATILKDWFLVQMDANGIKNYK